MSEKRTFFRQQKKPLINSDLTTLIRTKSTHERTTPLVLVSKYIIP